MLTIDGRVLQVKTKIEQRRAIIKLSEDADLPFSLRRERGYLMRSGESPEGFAAYVALPDVGVDTVFPEEATVVRLSDEFRYLGSNDIIRVDFADRSIRALFRADSRHNFFLVTEQCNSYCLMCSQPPKAVDDSWIINELREVIPLIPPATPEIGFTGGEPFLFGERFLDVLKLARTMLPKTAIHILSNGRLFSDKAFARRYASIKHPDMMVGIPLYSDDATIHDYVVQATGAFDETIRGILNLKEFGQRVEIRVVLHQQTVGRLPQLAEFISRNLLFVDQVALMGLEITGFTRANLEQLWIDPVDYSDQLRRAVSILEAYRIPLSIYNHQLCTVDRSLWDYCRKSISDWKNEYLDVCNSCSVKNECGGFFSSSKQYRHSDHIAPVPADQIS
jgi:His-Xaa-Ser system radical SAM maturase HxsC